MQSRTNREIQDHVFQQQLNDFQKSMIPESQVEEPDELEELEEQPPTGHKSVRNRVVLNKLENLEQIELFKQLKTTKRTASKGKQLKPKR